MMAIRVLGVAQAGATAAILMCGWAMVTWMIRVAGRTGVLPSVLNVVVTGPCDAF